VTAGRTERGRDSVAGWMTAAVNCSMAELLD
jgi:hypothetical protein